MGFLGKLAKGALKISPVGLAARALGAGPRGIAGAAMGAALPGIAGVGLRALLQRRGASPVGQLPPGLAKKMPQPGFAPPQPITPMPQNTTPPIMPPQAQGVPGGAMPGPMRRTPWAY